jgi:hypothetical protein
MYDHLRAWTTELDRDTSARLDLWDTGRTRNGKSELRYALAIIPHSDTCSPVVIFDGEEFWPSPLHAIDSDETAAALLSFFVADGESIRYAPDSDYADERARDYTERQRETLESNHELLSVWQNELEGAE